MAKCWGYGKPNKAYAFFCSLTCDFLHGYKTNVNKLQLLFSL